LKKRYEDLKEEGWQTNMRPRENLERELEVIITRNWERQGRIEKMSIAELDKNIEDLRSGKGSSSKEELNNKIKEAWG